MKVLFVVLTVLAAVTATKVTCVNCRETIFRSVFANCSLYGETCANVPDASTTSALCHVETCEAGCADCDRVYENGCEINLNSDANNCGQCGHKCEVAHAASICADGSCAISDCDPGFADCNGDVLDGCETSLLQDVHNCGVCGNLTPQGHTCNSGVRELSCQDGLINCAGQCSNLATDEQNCGACAHQCAAGYTCVNSECTIVCPAGTESCNGVCTNLYVDDRNCGTCGNRCGRGRICNGNGACQSDIVFETTPFDRSPSDRAIVSIDCAKMGRLGASAFSSLPVGWTKQFVLQNQDRRFSWAGRTPLLCRDGPRCNFAGWGPERTFNTYHPSDVASFGVYEVTFGRCHTDGTSACIYVDWTGGPYHVSNGVYPAAQFNTGWLHFKLMHINGVWRTLGGTGQGDGSSTFACLCVDCGNNCCTE